MAKERKYPDAWIYFVTVEDGNVTIDRRLAEWAGFGTYRTGRSSTMTPESVEKATNLRAVLESALALERGTLEHNTEMDARLLAERRALMVLFAKADPADLVIPGRRRPLAADDVVRFDRSEEDKRYDANLRRGIATLEALLAAMKPTVAACTHSMEELP